MVTNIFLAAPFSTSLHAQTWSSSGYSYPGMVWTLAAYNGGIEAGGVYSSPNEIRAMAVYNGNLYKCGANVGAPTNVYRNGVSIGTSGGGNLLFAMAVHNGALYVAGSFTSINGVAVNNIAKWNDTIWSPVGSGVGGANPSDIIYALCSYNNALYVGGNFSDCYKWDGTTWTITGTFTSSTGPNYGLIRSFGVYNGALYAGGFFDMVSGVSAVNIAEYNGGTLWSSIGDIGIANDPSDGLSVLREYNGSLYCGGNFSMAGGTNAENIARYTSGNWQALGSGTTGGVVNALLVFNQSLYVAGSFSSAGGISVSNIAKWNYCPVTIGAAGATTFCSPGSVILNATTVGTSYQWRLNGNNISGATSSTYTATVTGLYSCIIVTSCGSGTSNSIYVNSITTPSPSITPAGSTTFCNGDSVKLYSTIISGTTTQWLKDNITIPGANYWYYYASTSGNYTVTKTNSCFSATSSPVTITVNPLPSAAITSGGSTTFCSGDSVVLNAPLQANRSYQWKKGANNIINATAPGYTAKNSGTYKVTVTNTLTGCYKTTITPTVVTVNAKPAAVITPQGPTTFCAGGNVVLSANTGIGLTYNWKKNGAIINGATTANYTAGVTGNYTVKLINSNGCFKTSPPVTVSVPCKWGKEENGGDFNVSVYPNPSKGDFIFDIENVSEEDISISITDIAGRLIQSDMIHDSRFTISNLQLNPGIYFAQIRQGVSLKNIRLVKTANE